MIFVISATLWVVPLYLAVTFLGYVINQLVATLLISTLSTHHLHYLHYLHRWPASASTSSTSAVTWSTRTTPLPATATSLTCETLSTQYLQNIYKSSMNLHRYDRMVKMGGMPKRLDRLIEEVRHIEQVGYHNMYT